MDHNSESSTQQGVPAITQMPSEQGDRTAAALCHLLSFTQFLGVPLGGILGPLILWLVKRNDDALIDECGKEAVNFQISMFIYLMVSVVLIFLVVGILLLPVVLILNVVYTIIAAIRASEGESYRYPFTIRFIQ
ncbi:conserved hypothetical protein [Coraliomargarita akajimensis DSM 45221]|uniref:DUF4870 domain-containing protein n=2 Tax=Coraliomargarita TaxID=442430 RepID=D5EK79_CORAD|nr:conserved hypothetical protein [Coraliomargarita akajimensis DSM 45221]